MVVTVFSWGLLYPRSMRGDDQKQAAMFSYLTLAQRIPADHPARQIRVLGGPGAGAHGRGVGEVVFRHGPPVDRAGAAAAGHAFDDSVLHPLASGS